MSKFEKGKSGNPAGRPPMPKPIQKLRKVSRDKIAKLCDKLTKIPIDEVERIYANPKTSSLESMLAGVISKAVRDKDQIALNALFDRMVGKVKDIQEYSARITQTSPNTLPTGSQMLSSAIKLASGQLETLKHKASSGIELTESEQRSIATLSKTVLELNEEERKLRGGSSLAQLSDKELAKRVDEAKRIVTNRKLASAPIDKTKPN